MRFFFCLWIGCGLFAQDLRKDEWQVPLFVSDSTILGLCDKGVNRSPIAFFENEYTQSFDATLYNDICPGDIVWVACRFVKDFYRQVLPHVDHPFVLIVNDGDESFPSQSGLTKKEFVQLMDDEKIIHVFAQNCDWKETHPKLSLIPIGIDYHTIAYKGQTGGWGEVGTPLEQEALLQKITASFLPAEKRQTLAFVDFQHSDSIRYGEHKRYLEVGEDRTTLFNRLKKKGLIRYAGWMRRSELWKKKGSYAFSVSPHGNGLDCHRTWEDLILGCIVIVKTSTLDPLYEGLPVVIVQDWSEVTLEKMKQWKQMYKGLNYRERLTHAYWMDKIYAKALPYKGTL